MYEQNKNAIMNNMLLVIICQPSLKLIRPYYSLNNLLEQLLFHCHDNVSDARSHSLYM